MVCGRMKTILMILTHNRLDCLKICLEKLAASNEFHAFDHVVLLLNGVSAHHEHSVRKFMARHPDVAWDIIHGPGTRPDGISQIENACVQKYPGSVYVKIDEDIIVPAGWAPKLLQAHAANQARDDLALVTPLIPNNAFGLFMLLTTFYPELREAFRRQFGSDPSPEPQGPTWQSPAIGEWASRQFLQIDTANTRHQERLAASGQPEFLAFSHYFSIGCICYDYRHWQRMGGIPRTDEPGWCHWITDNRQSNILDQRQIVLHYSFFVQQEWLDRTTLLEDLRAANLPGTLGAPAAFKYWGPRWLRILRQVPGIIARKLH